MLPRDLSRRQALGLLSSALGATIASACVPASPARQGNTIVAVSTESPEDERLVPRNWDTTTVKIGGDFSALAALDSIQTLQLPSSRIPYVTGMLFYAPKEAPLVTIGIYYERNQGSRPARDIFTGATFGLQEISDPSLPLKFEPGQIKTVDSEKVSGDQLQWFTDHRQSIVDAMRASATGSLLSKTFDSDFTSRARPPANTPSALVITGGNYAGFKVPYTVIGRRILFQE
jgi:hypothetical protein